MTDAALYGSPEPGASQCIALVKKALGSNLMEIDTQHGVTGLAMLPTKFRKLIWVKRGDYVIVSEAEGAFETARGSAGAVRFCVDHILFGEQVETLRKAGKWPESFALPEKETDRGRRRDAAPSHMEPAAAAGEIDENESDEGSSDHSSGAAEEGADRGSRVESFQTEVSANRWAGISRGRPGELPPESSDDSEDDATDGSGTNAAAGTASSTELSSALASACTLLGPPASTTTSTALPER